MDNCFHTVLPGHLCQSRVVLKASAAIFILKIGQHCLFFKHDWNWKCPSRIFYHNIWNTLVIQWVVIAPNSLGSVQISDDLKALKSITVRGFACWGRGGITGALWFYNILHIFNMNRKVYHIIHTHLLESFSHTNIKKTRQISPK